MNATQQIANLLQLVPKPPEDSIPPGLDELHLDQFEGRTGITLPPMMRRWLMLTNGPCVGPGGFYGIRPMRSDLDIEGRIALFPEWRNRKWIPVAGDGCGNDYIMPTQNEFGTGLPIIFVDTTISPDVPIYVVASDLEHFLLGILQKEMGVKGWPFDPNHVLEFDPQITNCRDIKLPWDES